jgi:hypothetical protein
MQRLFALVIASLTLLAALPARADVRPNGPWDNGVASCPSQGIALAGTQVVLPRR